MRETEGLQQARQAFADQFEQAGDVVFYRRRGRGEPVAVSVWERDALISDFDRRIGHLYMGLTGLVMVILAVVAIAAVLLHQRPSLPVVALVLGPVALAYALLQHWLWDAPLRMVRRRGAVGAAAEPPPAS